MPDQDDPSGPGKYRDIADRLRGIAQSVRYNPQRVNQLHALADGFDRLADRVEREAISLCRP